MKIFSVWKDQRRVCDVGDRDPDPPSPELHRIAQRSLNRLQQQQQQAGVTGIELGFYTVIVGWRDQRPAATSRRCEIMVWFS